MPDTMNEVLHPGLEFDRDPDFPHAPEFWTRETAMEAAAREGLTLTETHWDAVRALQAYFARHESINAREVHDALDERFHAEGGMKYLYTLFPGGPIAQGCRVAGLDAPSGSVSPAGGTVK